MRIVSGIRVLLEACCKQAVPCDGRLAAVGAGAVLGFGPAPRPNAQCAADEAGASVREPSGLTRAR